MNKPKKCACGCGETTSGSTFIQGHDAKLKSKLLNQVRKCHGRVAEAAKKKLSNLGWYKASKAA